MSGEILVIGDGYSYDVTPACVLVGHSAGSATLDKPQPNDFVRIDGNLVVLKGTTHSSSCPMGCTMTITDTPDTHVTIGGTLIAINKSEGNMGGCHPTVTVPTNFQNKWVKIS